MLGRTWPRFALEALFLVAVAVAAGLLDLGIAAIVGVMVVAYAATVLVEWAASRSRAPKQEPAPLLAEPERAAFEPEPEADPNRNLNPSPSRNRSPSQSQNRNRSPNRNRARARAGTGARAGA